MEMKIAALFSIVSNTIIIVLKIFAGIVSGSIGIISEAIHSGADLFASLLTFFAVSKANEPADKDHPFGHGKYEDMSGFIEGGLIVFAGLFIISESVKKLFLGYELKNEPILGIYVMAFAVVANIIVSSYLFYVAKKNESVSLYADAQHLRMDVYSSMGVLFALLIIKYTGFAVIDPIIGILIALIIIKTGIKINKNALNDLLDGTLPQEDISAIETILSETTDIKGYKNLKCRRQGRCKEIEVTVFFEPDLNILQCHKICDRIEDLIKNKFTSVHTMIHLEPYKEIKQEYIENKISH